MKFMLNLRDLDGHIGFRESDSRVEVPEFTLLMYRNETEKINAETVTARMV